MTPRLSYLIIHISNSLNVVTLSTKLIYMSRNIWRTLTGSYHKNTEIHWRGASIYPTTSVVSFSLLLGTAYMLYN